MVKTKIIKRRIEIKVAKKKHNLIRCKCVKCGEKKWSQYNKKSNKKVALFIINLMVWTVAIDGITNWYESRGVWNFENAVAQVENQAQDQSRERSEEAPMEDGTSRGTNTVSVADVVGGTQVSSVSGSVIGTIKPIAEKYNLDWKILVALCLKESQCRADRVGDSGWSFGYYQIHQKYHPNTIKCAKDLECATEWTAKRLKRHESLGTWEMVRSHNGLVANNANSYYVEDVKAIIEKL